MAGIRFTDEQVSMLRSNPWVKSVTPKYVSFTKEFMEEFIALHSEGRTRYEIFESYGLPVDVMGKKTIKKTTDNWIEKANKSIALSNVRRGNCWDNAPMESFFGHAKDELHLRRCSTFGEVVTEIADYIDYYNNWRPQAGLGKMTPSESRDHLLAKPICLPVPAARENGNPSLGIPVSQ